MSEDRWLWDGSDPPDPEDAELVALASALAWRGASPEQRAELDAAIGRRASRRRRAGAGLAAAAAVLLAVAAGALWRGADRGGWAFQGTACGEETCVLAEGAWLETGEGEAVLEVADIGTLEVAAGSRLQLVATSGREHRLRLAEGSVHARVDAPPRLLVVETPAATAVDLGCEYDLLVASDGTNHLRVEHGQVALEGAGRDVRVPAGAVASSRPGRRPDTPYFADASSALRTALARLDAGARDALPSVLAESRPRDTLSLWHLLPVVDPADRAALLARMAELSPWIRWDLIDGAGAAALDPAALEDLWNELTTTF